MSETQGSGEGAQKTMSEAEMAQAKQRMHKWYDAQIPLLKKQREYETLLADIQEAQLRKDSCLIQHAGLLAAQQRLAEGGDKKPVTDPPLPPNPPVDEGDGTATEQPKRTLKRADQPKKE